MNLNKPMVSSKKKNSRKTTVRIPTKRTMNFVHQQRYFRPVVMLPVLLVVILVIGALGYFGVLKPIEKKTNALMELNSRQMELAAYQDKLKDYEELRKQHGRYSDIWMTEEELAVVDPIDVLDLVEEKVATKAFFSNISFGGNVLSMDLNGLTLEQGGALVDDLETSPLVASAYIYSAVAEEAAEANIHLTINLTREVEENDPD